MKQIWAGLIFATMCCAGAMAACGGDDDDDSNPSQQGSGGKGGGSSTGGSGGSGTGGGNTGGSGGSNGDAQTPPQGAEAVEAWLTTGAYKQWKCEPEKHESRSPSPHGYNRICSNNAIATNVEGDADWPEGAAAVKELFADEDEATPSGYAVYLKTKADSAGGDNWYWYERLPGKSTSVADGFGNEGPAKTICVACHAAAGADADHTPTIGGRDQVYTPVP
jgi:hypothetical protein